jgi:hypothetical protein
MAIVPYRLAVSTGKTAPDFNLAQMDGWKPKRFYRIFKNSDLETFISEKLFRVRSSGSPIPSG